MKHVIFKKNSFYGVENMAYKVTADTNSEEVSCVRDALTSTAFILQRWKMLPEAKHARIVSLWTNKV